MPAGGEREAARGGKVSVGYFGDDKGDSAGGNGFLNGPEHVGQLARMHHQPGCVMGRESPQGTVGHAAMLQAKAGLRDPEKSPCPVGVAPFGAGREGKTGQRRHVPETGLCQFMHTGLGKAKRKGGAHGRTRRLGTHDAFRLEGCEVHMFLFCSFASESSWGADSEVEIRQPCRQQGLLGAQGVSRLLLCPVQEADTVAGADLAK